GAPGIRRLRRRGRLRLPLSPALPRPEGRALLHLLRQAPTPGGAGADDALGPALRLPGAHRGGPRRRVLGGAQLRPRLLVPRPQDPRHPGDLAALRRRPPAPPPAPLAGATDRPGEPGRPLRHPLLAGRRQLLLHRVPRLPLGAPERVWALPSIRRRGRAPILPSSSWGPTSAALP